MEGRFTTQPTGTACIQMNVSSPPYTATPPPHTPKGIGMYAATPSAIDTANRILTAVVVASFLTIISVGVVEVCGGLWGVGWGHPCGRVGVLSLACPKGGPFAFALVWPEALGCVCFPPLSCLLSVQLGRVLLSGWRGCRRVAASRYWEWPVCYCEWWASSPRPHAWHGQNRPLGWCTEYRSPR